MRRDRHDEAIDDLRKRLTNKQLSYAHSTLRYNLQNKLCGRPPQICPRPQQVVTWRAAHFICPSGDLELWPFDLQTGVHCQRRHGQASSQFWCSCDCSLSCYGQRYAKLTTWRCNLDLWPLTFEVSAHVGDSDRRTPSVYQVWSSSAFPFRRYGWFSVRALSCLVTLTLTFWPLKGVTDRSCNGLPSCQFSASHALPFST